jgi:transcriptional regulator with XRE-family HTH domain
MTVMKQADTEVSPVRVWRQSTGLTGLELALVAGCHEAEVTRAENGSVIPQRLLDYLVGVGLDRRQVIEEQERFRAARRESVNERVLAHGRQ